MNTEEETNSAQQLNQNDAALPIARKLITNLLPEPSASAKDILAQISTTSFLPNAIAQPRSEASESQPRIETMETILEMAKIGTIALKLAKNGAFESTLGPQKNTEKSFSAVNNPEKVTNLPAVQEQTIAVEKKFFPAEISEHDVPNLVEKSMQISAPVKKPYLSELSGTTAAEKKQIPESAKVETKNLEFPTADEDSGLLFYKLFNF